MLPDFTAAARGLDIERSGCVVAEWAVPETIDPWKHPTDEFQDVRFGDFESLVIHISHTPPATDLRRIATMDAMTTQVIMAAPKARKTVEGISEVPVTASAR